MSVMDNPRVSQTGSDSYAVASDVGRIVVLPNEALGWGLYRGASLELVSDGSGFAIGFSSAEEAVEVALGVKAA
jgi:hypothetical protein